MTLTDKDLETMCDHAFALRNVCPGSEHEDGETPDITHLWEDKDSGRIFGSDEWNEGLAAAHMDAGTDVLVGGDCVLAHVPTNEGQSMPQVAEAIAAAGSDILALVAEVKRLQGRGSTVGPPFVT